MRHRLNPYTSSKQTFSQAQRILREPAIPKYTKLFNRSYQVRLIKILNYLRDNNTL